MRLAAASPHNRKPVALHLGEERRIEHRVPRVVLGHRVRETKSGAGYRATATRVVASLERSIQPFISVRRKIGNTSNQIAYRISDGVKLATTNIVACDEQHFVL